MNIAICFAFAVAAIADVPPGTPDEAPATYTAKAVQLPRAARQGIFQASDLLSKRATRISRGTKAALDVWLPSYVPPPDGLYDGSLLAILAPPERPSPENMVTVRTVEKGMRVDFSTIEREEADRRLLELRRALGTWRRFDEGQPLALVGPEEPVWLELARKGPQAMLHSEAGELYITLALRPEQKRGVRWQLPPHIRKMLGL